LGRGGENRWLVGGERSLEGTTTSYAGGINLQLVNKPGGKGLNKRKNEVELRDNGHFECQSGQEGNVGKAHVTKEFSTEGVT